MTFNNEVGLELSKNDFKKMILFHDHGIGGFEIFMISQNEQRFSRSQNKLDLFGVQWMKQFFNSLR